jgi:hypothetical protein
MVNDAGAEVDAITGLKAATNFGRPNWDRYFPHWHWLMEGCLRGFDNFMSGVNLVRMGRILLLARFVIFVRGANLFRRIFDSMISVNYLLGGVV